MQTPLRKRAAKSAALALLLALLGTPLACNTTRSVQAQKEVLELGKVTRKRQIAPLFSAEHAEWLTRADREESEQPEKVLDALKIPEGATVADIGAGVGYFTWRLAQR